MNKKIVKNSIKSVISLAIIGVVVWVIFFANSNPITDDSTQKWATQARVDLKTAVSLPQKQLRVFFKGAEQTKASWDKGIDTYAMHSEDEKLVFKIEPISDAKTEILLRGPYKFVSAGKAQKLQVKYTSVKINGEEMLKKDQTVWHDQPYIITFDAKKGQEYTVEATWRK